MTKSIGIIGGGIVGLAIALKLRRLLPDAPVTVWEKEPTLGQHQSTRNSGVLHAGLYYKPGSLKAKLAVRGIRKTVAFAAQHGVNHEICGKLVVATDEDEVHRLQVLHQRGVTNGLAGLRWLNREQMLEMEPHVGGIAAVYVPEEGIIDYAAVVRVMRELLEEQDVRVLTGSRATPRFEGHEKKWRITSAHGDARKHFLVNCAGLYSDRVAKAAGDRVADKIVPFRGEYYRLKQASQGLVRNLIYPVPDPTFPFLGVHFTRLINGGTEAGPNAIFALAREGYRKGSVSLVDTLESLSFPGLWRFVQRHGRMCADEVLRSYSRQRFCASLQKLVPAVSEADLTVGGAGVRAQAMARTGELVQDFLLIQRPNALHVLNAPSPAATASLAIGEHLAANAARLLAN